MYTSFKLGLIIMSLAVFISLVFAGEEEKYPAKLATGEHLSLEKKEALQ